MSLITKFRTDPALFFSESLSAPVRSLGEGLEKVLFNKKSFLSFLIDPAETLSECNSIFLSSIGNRIVRFQWLRRERYIESSQRPLISIIMASYNAQGTLVSAIESIQAQTYSNWELIIVDDVSTDESFQICQEYATRDSRIRVICNSKNRGVAQTRNSGLETAKGDYITFQDSDDLSHPERLERQLYELLKSDGMVVCTCRYARVNDALEPVSVNGKTSRKCIIAMMFHAGRVKSRIGYFIDSPIGEDTEFYERIKIVFGESSERHIVKVLYSAKLSLDSLLFADAKIESLTTTSIAYVVSGKNEKVVRQVNEFHRKIVTGEQSSYISLKK